MNHSWVLPGILTLLFFWYFYPDSIDDYGYHTAPLVGLTLTAIVWAVYFGVMLAVRQ